MQRKFMLEALKLADEAFENGEIPVGCVIEKDGEIIAVGRNRREEKQNALSHAETEAINSACKSLNTWRLDGCTMYVTLEPCVMCMGAIINSRIDTLVFGAFDLNCGCAESLLNPNKSFRSDKPEIFGGIMEDECQKIIKDFFEAVRKNEKPKAENS